MAQTCKFGIDLWDNIQVLDIEQKTIGKSTVPCSDNSEDEVNKVYLVSWNLVNHDKTMKLITHLTSHCMAIDILGQC